jgi:hydrogenase maturation protease
MTEPAGTSPILVFGYGNLSRGDDALGPCLIERLDALRAAGRLPGVDLLTDCQPQIEHVLDLRGRARVIFVDADLGPLPATPCPPWRLLPVAPEADIGWTSHQFEPSQLAGLLHRLYPGPHPLLQLLAIRGRDLALSNRLSDEAQANLNSAVRMLVAELGH